MRKFFLVLLLLLLVKANSYAQNTISLEVPRITPVSPTAAAMNKYQSYPVDHSTGVPNITIPLYEIVAGEVTIPVTLSYHASGLKPKEQSGIAGTGWTLNLEPSVTRQVNGRADEWEYGWFSGAYKNSGIYGTGDINVLRYFNDKANNRIDTQPDKFTYKLPNGGGSGFFTDRYSLLQTIPYKHDRVEFSDGGAGINITDGNGVEYKFYGTYEKTGDIKTRWMCNSIWSPRNPSSALVTFKYEAIRKTSGMGTFYNLDSRILGTTGTNYHDVLVEQSININRYYSITKPSYPTSDIPEAAITPISSTGAGVIYPLVNRHVQDDIYVTNLNEVLFLGNKLYVQYKGVGVTPHNSRVLDEIEVTDKDGAVVRTIKFYITPYNSNTSLTKLDSVVISAPGVESQKYTFNYYNKSNVPSIYTVAVDHWGFCNGQSKTTDGVTVPNFKKILRLNAEDSRYNDLVYLNYAGINREPNHEYTKSGVLSEIINPQGIKTEFHYDGNFGAFRDNSDKYERKEYLHPVGGLRIKQIRTVDPKTGKSINTDYKYGLTKPNVENYEPVWGGGAIKHIVTIGDYGSAIWSEGISTISSMPSSNITFNGGSAVLYNIIEEETWGSDNKDTKHKTRYFYNVKYHDFEDILKINKYNTDKSAQLFLDELAKNIIEEKRKSGSGVPNQYESLKNIMNKLVRPELPHPNELSDDFVDHFLSTNQFEGKLIRTEHFRNTQIVLSTDYIYSQKLVDERYTPVDLPIGNVTEEQFLYYTQNPHACPSPSSYFNQGRNYPDYVNRKPQTTFYLDHSIYSPLDKEITKEYHYINGRQDAVTTEKSYTYNYNWQAPLSFINPRSIETTNSDNTKIIDEFEYLVNYPAILSYHKQKKNNNWIESRILFKENTPLPQKVQSKTNQMQDFRDEVIYNAYDSHGNVTEIMGKDGTPISILWGYRKQFPVAKIENASIQQIIDAIGFSEIHDTDIPGSDVMSKINSLRTKLPTARVTTYEYKPLQGVTAITDPNNITTKFEYDGYNRLTDSYYLDVKSQSDIRKVMLQKYIYNLGK